MLKNAAKIKIKMSDNNTLNSINCDICKGKDADFRYPNGWGTYTYICLDCAYLKGYINWIGVNTMHGNSIGLEDIYTYR